jgi:DNA-binding transcriptional MerR regulator
VTTRPAAERRDDGDMLGIGELARVSRESVRTLRFWSDRGLLDVERSDSGYRRFSHTAIDRVDFIRRAQALGFSLDEVRDIVRLRSEGVQPCQHVHARLREHLESVRERLRALHALEDELERRTIWAAGEREPECGRGCVYLTADPPTRSRR